MKPEWRTGDVVALCEQMRKSQDYSACPILADALEDAGCDDAARLALLRSFTGTPSLRQRLVAEAYSDESTAAVAWVEDFAAALGGYDDPDDDEGKIQRLSYFDLMDCAGTWLAHGAVMTNYRDHPYWSMHLRDHLDDHLAEFWNNYELVTGRVVDPEYRETFFECSC